MEKTELNIKEKKTTITTDNNKLLYIPSLDNLSAYKKAVYSIQDLSLEEEKALAKKLQKLNYIQSIIDVDVDDDNNHYDEFEFNHTSIEKSNSQELIQENISKEAMIAAQQLMLPQLKTVVRIAHEFRHYGLDEADLIQEGNIGLMKAVRHFDPERNIRLYTFSIVWIKSEMQSYIIKNLKNVKIATTKSLKKLFFNYRSLYKDFENQGIDKNLIPKKIQESLNVNMDDINEIAKYFANEDVSFDIIDVNDDDENHHYQSTPPALIENKTPEYYMQEYRDKNNMMEQIQQIYHSLDEKEKIIIKSRFLIDPKKTYKEIGKEIGFSSERVRQLEQKTIDKIKNILSIKK